MESDTKTRPIRADEKMKRHSEKRTAIELGALEVLRKGVEKFSIVNVAKAAGISKPAVYYYFDDERELAIELALRVLTDEIAYVESGGSMSPPDVVRARLEFYRDDQLRYDIVYVLAPSRGARPDLERSSQWQTLRAWSGNSGLVEVALAMGGER